MDSPYFVPDIVKQFVFYFYRQACLPRFCMGSLLSWVAQPRLTLLPALLLCQRTGTSGGRRRKACSGCGSTRRRPTPQTSAARDRSSTQHQASVQRP